MNPFGFAAPCNNICNEFFYLTISKTYNKNYHKNQKIENHNSMLCTLFKKIN